MKILIFSDEFPPLGNRRAYNLFYFLKDFAHHPEFEIDVITTSRKSIKKEMFADNIFIYYVDVGRKGSESSLSLWEKVKYSSSAFRFFKKNFRKKKYDLVHFFSHFTATLLYKRLPSIKFITTIYPNDLYQNASLIKRHYLRKVAKKSFATIATCEADYQLLQSLNLRSSSYLIYHGVSKGVGRSFLFNFKKNKKITLVSVGRLIQKGEYDFLIQALHGMSDYRLLIIGEGKFRKKLEKLSLKLGVDVVFLGRLNNENAKKIIKNSDVFITVSSFGGISTSMLEAMAIGLPVIGYNSGGLQEIIKDSGFVLEQNDISGLRAVLDIYRNNKGLIKKHGLQAKKITSLFSNTYTGNQYRAIYELIRQKSSIDKNKLAKG